MCLNLSPSMPEPPPPPPPPPSPSAMRLFEARPESPDERLVDGFGLEQLRIRPPQVGTG